MYKSKLSDREKKIIRISELIMELSDSEFKSFYNFCVNQMMDKKTIEAICSVRMGGHVIDK